MTTQFLQINLHGCKGAQDLMHKTAKENTIDFNLISEQYKTGGANWYPDSNNNAAAVSF